MLFFQVANMVDNIQLSFYDTLNKNEWMDESTRQAAISKVTVTDSLISSNCNDHLVDCMIYTVLMCLFCEIMSHRWYIHDVFFV